ncbi:MAG: hypothetical protein AAFP97_05135 [Pseudomonadota bacterium]
MSAIVWVHWEALSEDHPVFSAAPDDARRIFGWDADDLARRDWSLKRCVFVLECLEDMGVEIMEGRPSDVLNDLNSSSVFTATSPDPYIRQEITKIEADVSVIKAEPFASVPENVDMKRFFRYWNKAKKTVLLPTENQTYS